LRSGLLWGAAGVAMVALVIAVAPTTSPSPAHSATPSAGPVECIDICTPPSPGRLHALMAERSNSERICLGFPPESTDYGNPAVLDVGWSEFTPEEVAQITARRALLVQALAVRQRFEAAPWFGGAWFEQRGTGFVHVQTTQAASAADLAALRAAFDPGAAFALEVVRYSHAEIDAAKAGIIRAHLQDEGLVVDAAEDDDRQNGIDVEVDHPTAQLQQMLAARFAGPPIVLNDPDCGGQSLDVAEAALRVPGKWHSGLGVDNPGKASR